MIIMPTRLAYYEDPYLTTIDAEILRVDNADKRINVFLDTTIFYPFGGGQPSDQGTIATETAKAEVRNAQIAGDVVRHECQLIEGTMSDGESAKLFINWERRYQNMKVHTAGHIIHDVLTQKTNDLVPLRGDHGSKPFLEYQSSVAFPAEFWKTLEFEVNQIIENGREVVTRETTLEELRKIARYIPANLPVNKPLRIIQIEGFPAMPDGGTQVRNLSEIGPVEIVSINTKEDKTILSYRLAKG